MTKNIIAILEKINGATAVKTEKVEDRKWFVGFERGYEEDNMICVVYEDSAESVIKSVFKPHPFSDDPIEDLTGKVIVGLAAEELAGRDFDEFGLI